MTARKKLIEVSIPLEVINLASKKQKAPKGYPTSLHTYWAPRPLAACRAVLFSQLVDDPSAWPERFVGEEAQEVERKRLHAVIAELVQWENSNNELILNQARWEIARSLAWGSGEEPPPRDDGTAILAYLQKNAPPIYDPFCGGGSIPLEAQRLGLRAYGSDINPIAVLISKALVEIPAKFAGLKPVHPGHDTLRRYRGAQGLAEDVQYYANWMRDEAEGRLGHLYPPVQLPDGSKAPIIAWLWARTVRSPDPRAKGAMVPLVSSYMVSTKEGRKTWVEPLVDGGALDGWRFEVRTGVLTKADEEALKKGTKSAKGQAFTCILTGAAINRSYIQAEGKAERLGTRLMAIVAEIKRSRIYVTPDAEHESIAKLSDKDAIVEEARLGFLSTATPTRAMITGGVCSAYGLSTWGHLFTSRQVVALTTFADLVREAREKILADGRAAGRSDLSTPLHAGGFGAAAYADAVAIYLAFLIDRAANYGSSLSTWLPDDNAIRGTFGRQALPMTWDFCEGSYFGKSSADITTIAKTISDVVRNLFAETPGLISQVDAPLNTYPMAPCVLNTDPPYYDNVGYADLSDFFYVWLRKSLANMWPELFRRLTTPKSEELVATPYHHGGKQQADVFFIEGMRKAMAAMHEAATDNEPLIIYYAYKQSELAEDGVNSPGWTSFLQAVIDAGLGVDGTWPLRTESAGRLIGRGANALASSIVHVCRKRPSDAPIVMRADFLRALRHEMPAAVNQIRKAGIGAVDMEQSIIGPGMGIFSRYARVLEDDDSPMSVGAALALINRVWGEIENDLDNNFDAETQVALAWFATYGFAARPSGDLIGMANAKNIPIAALFRSGVFQNLHGSAGLTPREKLLEAGSPVTDRNATVWECTQHTARVLKDDERGGAEAAARLVAAMGAKAEDARALAYRLYEIASQKGWAAEALVYNELAQEWSRLDDQAARYQSAPPIRDLFGEVAR